MVELSILIPARNEMFLARTIQDILENSRADTEVIAVLDGQWAEPPIADHERVSLIYHAESIGQRAATNEAARLARGKYVMKVDAHCAFAPGFDAQLLADMQDDWTMVPVMRNLHAFDWVCEDGHRRYQGPSGPCQMCGKPTTMDVVWIAKTNPQSKSYCFDSTPHFQYWGEYTKRPEYKTALEKTHITETMSLQGSCFMLTRERYFALDICDESFGSWGSQGIEVACKTWLSGGKCVVNHATWYAHVFRTSGGDFGFPYPLSGRQVEQAKNKARDLFFENKFKEQIYPLSWLLKKFWPVNGWTDEDLRLVMEAGASFVDLRSKLIGSLGVVGPIPCAMTDHTSPMAIDGRGQEMPIFAVSSPSLPCGRTISDQDIFFIGKKPEVVGITTGSISTDMVNDRDILALPLRDRSNTQGVYQPMSNIENLVDPNLPVAVGCGVSSPVPAASNRIDADLSKEFGDLIVGKRGDCEIIGTSHSVSPIQTLSRLEADRAATRSASFIIPQLTKGIVYYTDNRLDVELMKACQWQLMKIGLPITSVGLEPMPWFGRNLTLELERGYLTMFKQILAGLEESISDVIYFCEHDVLYHPSHFDFIPPARDKFYYNVNVWKVDAQSGRALHYDCQQTSGLCAYRETLVEHYRTRVANTEAALARLGDGHEFRNWIRGQGFEPGTHHRAERVDDLTAESWCSDLPNVDVRHGDNLTPSRWSKEEFRNQKYTAGWTEAEEVPGWGRTMGRFTEWLREI